MRETKWKDKKMEISKLGEVLRSYTDKLKYNSGFAAFKRNYVRTNYDEQSEYMQYLKWKIHKSNTKR